MSADPNLCQHDFATNVINGQPVKACQLCGMGYLDFIVRLQQHRWGGGVAPTCRAPPHQRRVEKDGMVIVGPEA